MIVRLKVSFWTGDNRRPVPSKGYGWKVRAECNIVLFCLSDDKFIDAKISPS